MRPRVLWIAGIYSGRILKGKAEAQSKEMMME